MGKDPNRAYEIFCKAEPDAALILQTALAMAANSLQEILHTRHGDMWEFNAETIANSAEIPVRALKDFVEHRAKVMSPLTLARLADALGCALEIKFVPKKKQ